MVATVAKSSCSNIKISNELFIQYMLYPRLEKMFMAVMFGLFENDEVEELDRLEVEGLVRFYSQEQIHVRMILDVGYVRLMDGHGGVKAVDIK